MERDGLISAKLSFAASFIAFCVVAVVLVGARRSHEKGRDLRPFFFRLRG
jgi:hypothetical protein